MKNNNDLKTEYFRNVTRGGHGFAINWFKIRLNERIKELKKEQNEKQI